MKIGPASQRDGVPPRESEPVEPKGRKQAKAVEKDELTLSERVRSWLKATDDNLQLAPTPVPPPAYTEAAVRSKGAPESAIAPEKLAAIRERIESGFYEQEAIKRIVAERLEKDLIGPDSPADM